MPYDEVVSAWRRAMAIAYEPAKLFARYQYQCEYTYTQRIKVPVADELKTWPNIRRGLIMLRNIFWKVGVLGDYKRVFWKFALGRIRKGDIEGLIGSTLIAHHLIEFARLATTASRTPRTIRSGCASLPSLPSEPSLKSPASPRYVGDLRALTPARVGLGRAGSGLPTEALLDFTLDHARARDAVHAAFDTRKPRRIARRTRPRSRAGIAAACRTGRIICAGPTSVACSMPTSHAMLAGRARDACELVLVIADGLSPTAVNLHAAGVIAQLLPLLAETDIVIGHAVVASGARVALGDEIGEILRARLVAMLIGERPGIVGARQPGRLFDLRPENRPQRCGAQLRLQHPRFRAQFRGSRVQDCVADPRGAGAQISGVALKDESGEAVSRRITKPV